MTTPPPAQSVAVRWTDHLLLGVLLVVAVFAIYANSLQGPFIFDDYDTIIENPHFNRPQSPLAGRPLVTLTFQFNHAVGGLNVRGYHLTNIAIHAACGLLLMALLWRTFNLMHRRWPTALPLPMRNSSGARLAGAFVITLIWLVHPLQTEAVNYITQRTESMMSFFYLLMLYAVARTHDHDDDARRSRWSWTALAIIACAMGMACKESMVTAPVAAILYDRAFAINSWKQLLCRRWRTYLGLALSWLLLAWLMHSGPRSDTVHFDLLTNSVSRQSALNYAMYQPTAILNYLRLIIWPSPLILDYGDVESVPLAEFIPQLCGLCFLLFTALLLWKNRPAAGFTMIIFLLILAPTSSIVPIISEIAAERRVYLASAAIIALIICASWSFMHRMLGPSTANKTGLVLLILITLVFALLVTNRNRDYASRVTIWQSSVDAKPDIARAHYNLGLLRGASGNVNLASREFADAVELQPDHHKARFSLGQALFDLKKFEQAFDTFLELHRRSPHYRDADRYIADLLDIQSKPKAALDWLIRATREKQGDEEFTSILWQELGRRYLDKKQFADAAKTFEQAIKLTPQSAPAYNFMGIALEFINDLDGSIDAYQHALTFSPGMPQAQFNLARVMEKRNQSTSQP